MKQEDYCVWVTGKIDFTTIQYYTVSVVEVI